MGGSIPLHEQISIKNDFLNDADLLGQFADAGEFVDLDTGVAAAFMTNGGCLAWGEAIQEEEEEERQTEEEKAARALEEVSDGNGSFIEWLRGEMMWIRGGWMERSAGESTSSGKSMDGVGVFMELREKEEICYFLRKMENQNVEKGKTQRN